MRFVSRVVQRLHSGTYLICSGHHHCGAKRFNQSRSAKAARTSLGVTVCMGSDEDMHLRVTAPLTTACLWQRTQHLRREYREAEFGSIWADFAIARQGMGDVGDDSVQSALVRPGIRHLDHMPSFPGAG
jgi:hypothetical protein